MPDRTVVDGIAVWEWPGEPPDLFLMHGIGNYGRYWDFFAQAVGWRHRMIAPDARGHGDSPKPAAGYAPSDFVADAVRVMERKKTGRCVVVGHSMGGFHATALTLTHPKRVGALVLVDVGPRSEPDSVGAGRARRLSLGRPDSFPNEAAALAYLRDTSPGYADAVYANRIAHVFRREGGTFRSRVLRRDDGTLVWRSSKNALRQILESTASSVWSDVWDRLGEIEAPVLIVRGTRSASMSADTAKTMLANLKHGELLELDAGHNVALDQPQALAEAVVRFAKKLIV